VRRRQRGIEACVARLSAQKSSNVHPNARTHARTHTRTHARTHARTHSWGKRGARTRRACFAEEARRRRGGGDKGQGTRTGGRVDVCCFAAGIRTNAMLTCAAYMRCLHALLTCTPSINRSVTHAHPPSTLSHLALQPWGWGLRCEVWSLGA
jgi:hypothetical protein